MKYKRVFIVLALLFVGVILVSLAERASELYLWLEGASGSYRYDVLFETRPSYILGAGSLGVLLGGIRASIRNSTNETSDEISQKSIKRHTALGTFLEHWTVALGTFILIISGILLGFLFVPRFATSPEMVGLALNIHFGGVLLLIFGGFYHITNHSIMGDNQIIPSREDWRKSINDVGNYIGVSEKTEGDKYLSIQKVSYIIIAGLLTALTVTGLVKSAVFFGSVSSAMAGTMTLLHDIFALLTIVFIIGHIAITLIPSHWPLLRAQITGWIPAEYVEKHHPQWYDKLKQ